MIDNLFDNLDDPRRQALLMMAAGLLSPVRGKGMAGVGEAMSRGIEGGLLGFNQASNAKQSKEMRDVQKKILDAQLKGQAREQQFTDALARGIKPGVGAEPLTRVDDEGLPMPSPRPSYDFAEAMQIDPLRGAQAQKAFQDLYKPPPPVTLKEGEVAYDPSTRLPVFQNPKPKDSFRQLTDAEASQLGLPPGLGYQVNTATGRIDSVGSRAPVTNVTTNVNNPKETFKDSLTLKKDFDSQPEVKGFKEVRSAWDQISTALSNPSGANDLAAATKFMKLLDPGSVVRESELAMAMQATGALDRFTNYHNQLINGQKLTPNQRKDFFAAGKALHDAARSRYDQTVNQYQGIAKQYELDPSFIVRGDAKLVKNTTKLVEGRQAIARGVPRDAVIQRLIEGGYDPEGL